MRAEEIDRSRKDKLAFLEEAARRYNHYLKEHPRAKLEAAERILKQKAQKMRISPWASIQVNNRALSVHLDDTALAEVSKLDGCYVLKTDLCSGLADKTTINAR